MLPHNELSDAKFRRQIQDLLARAAGYAWSIVRNREDAEDAVQEAALKALRNRLGYDCSLPFKGWWFSIVRNCCLDLLRSRRRGPSLEHVDGNDVPAEDPPDAHRHEELCRALESLSAPHREILQLRYFGDCSYREIAAALMIPVGSVMSRLHAARLALAGILRKEDP